MLKGLSALIFILISNLSIDAQNSFNIRISKGISSKGLNLWELSNGFLINGIYIDTTGGINQKLYFELFDANGQSQFETCFGDDTTVFQAIEGNNLQMNDTLFNFVTVTFIDGLMHGSLIWNNNLGDTISVQHFVSPYLDDNDISNTDWMRPTHISTVSGNYYYMSSHIGMPETGNDFCILKFTPEGDEIWTYIYATNADPDRCLAIEATVDGGVLVALWEFNIIENFTASKLLKLDSNGNEMWIVEMDYTFAISDFLLEDDGVVVATYKTNGTLGYTGFVYKADTLGNTIWEQNLGANYSFEQKMTHIVKSNNGGYVVAGRNYELQPDSIEINGAYNWNGWLVKLDNEGEIVWDRKYHHVESTQDDHVIYDLKATSDGGYIFCGEATDHDFENPDTELPIQQAWLVKVDGCGCLVPGCDPTCTTGVAETVIDYESTHFLAGPNPASQFINIHILDERFSHDREVRIFDLQGKVVKDFSAGQGGTTYMADVEDLGSGVYLVSLFLDGVVVQTERIIKD